MHDSRLRVLHAIHDFLPRHRAGSEIYALNLCQELRRRCHVTVLCADYDPSRAHGSLAWRLHKGVPVVECVNNWVFQTLGDTYRSPLIGRRLEQVLDIVQPDVLHVHNLLNLSFDLPAQARARRIPVVATLHDYTLVCASGGQRLHTAEQHVCRAIDVDRCARCFRESPFYDQMTVGRVASVTQTSSALQRLARTGGRLLPAAVVSRTARAVGRAAGPTVTAADITRRLDAARAIFDDVDLFVAPSGSLAEEYRQLGMPPEKLRVSDYGFPALPGQVERVPSDHLRIGFVGSVVWHKGAHVLVESAKLLPRSGWRITIFGDLTVSPGYADMLKRSAGDLPIRFAGGFDRADAASVYSQIDVLVVPSLWLENSPLVIHEAFLAGAPVVGSRIGGTTDLVHDGVDGFLYEPTSPVALADILRRLIEKPEVVRELAGRAPAVKTIERDAAEWLSLYDEVTSDATRPQPPSPA